MRRPATETPPGRVLSPDRGRKTTRTPVSQARGRTARLAFASKTPINAASARPGRELNGRPPGALRGSGRTSRSGVPCSRLQSIRAFPKGSKGLAPDDEPGTEERHSHAAVRTRLSCAPGCQRAAGRGTDRPVQGRHRADGRQGRQDRILGRQVAHLPHPQEPQGAFHAAQRRRAAGGARRDRAPAAHQRRRAALSHGARRRARGRPVGDDAQGRPRPRARRPRSARLRRRWRRPAAIGDRRPRRSRPRRDRDDRAARDDGDAVAAKEE